MENETQKIQVEVDREMTDREMLAEIYDFTRKTKNYMKWQLIITVAFVVIPLIGTIIIIPFALKSVTSLYSSYGLDSISGGTENIQVQDLIDQYTK